MTAYWRETWSRDHPVASFHANGPWNGEKCTDNKVILEEGKVFTGIGGAIVGILPFGCAQV